MLKLLYLCAALVAGLIGSRAHAISITIENCYLPQAAPILEAHFLGGHGASRAEKYIEANGATALVRKWFGNVDVNQLAYVRQTLINITTATDANRTKHACVHQSNTPCQQGNAAYVMTNSEEVVSHYCPVFHTYSLNVKASMVVHELSHAKTIRGTGDHCYGSTSCQSLARTRPELAIRNADSYALFVQELMKW